ncbi:MAG: pentapeptide repeat-containing protein, partial [Phycisphaerales bacterium]
GYAGFDWASFGGRVGFESASFGGYAGLNSASFGGYEGLESASFGGDAGFISASFGGAADFESASFGGHANFRLASFGGDADFRSASFKRSVFVERCTFAVQPVFVAARFSDQQAFKTDASFAAARFQNDAGDTASFGRRVPSLEARTGSASPRSAAARLRGWRGFVARRFWWRAVVRGSSRRLRWDTVRAFGESAILTRASTSALVLVPITTALWPALRRAVEHIGQQQGGQLLLPEGTSGVLPDDATLVISETTATGLTPTSPETAWVLPEDMPWVWAALFFAALFVVLGRVLYQAFVPHEVREATRVDFIEQQATTYRQAEPDERRQLIQRALEAVDQAGRAPVLREFRHRRLVRDDGLVVWIPERVEDFEYDAGRVPNPARRDDVRAALGKAGASEEDEAWDGSSAKPQMLRTAEPVMSADSRRVIAVRAGAEARYDLVTRQHRRWAWAAMWLYTLAMVLVIVVVYDQSMAILRETGLHGASEVVRYGLPAVCLVALTGMLSWLVIDALFGWLWPNLGRRWKRLTAG